jgi:uncharacterized membrane protein YdfJ with MMPL/SSD domain
MKPDKIMQNKIETTLNSLKGVQRASPSPFFYTRLIAKLNSSQQTIWEKFGTIITRPVIAFAFMCLIVLMNVIVVYTNSRQISPTDQNEIVSAEDLTTDAPNFYTLENNKP